MNKVEFYNSVVKVYNETGQGVPGFLKMKIGSSVIDGLIKEGYLKSVTIPFNHLPDDETICLTKGYCVEEDMQDRSTLPLSYLRLYKGIEQGLENLTGWTNQKLLKDPEFVAGYSLWLSKNHDKLAQKIEFLDENMKFQSLTSEEKAYMMSKEWFTENKSISKCLELIQDRNVNLREQLSLYKQLIRLYESTPSHHSKLSEANSDKSKIEDELKMRQSIVDFLNECKDKKTKIQDWVSVN